MGGIVCAIHRNAVLRFEGVPVGAAKLKEFDAQMRQLLNVTTIAEEVAKIEARGREVCSRLAKATWSAADREYLYAMVEGLYEE